MINEIYEVIEIAHKYADDKNIDELKKLKDKFQNLIDNESFEDEEIEKRYFYFECVYQINSIIDSLEVFTDEYQVKVDNNSDNNKGIPINKIDFSNLSNDDLIKEFASNRELYLQDGCNFEARPEDWNHSSLNLIKKWEAEEKKDQIHTAFIASQYLNEDGSLKKSANGLFEKTLKSLGLYQIARDQGLEFKDKQIHTELYEFINRINILPKIKFKTDKITYAYGFKVMPVETNGNIYKEYFGLTRNENQKPVIIKIKNIDYNAFIKITYKDAPETSNNIIQSLHDIYEIEFLYNNISLIETKEAICNLGNYKYDITFNVIHQESNIFIIKTNSY